MSNSIIEEALTIEGNMKSEQGSVEVKGKVIGDVSAKSVVVRTNGSLAGAVSAETVTIEGKQTGSIKCADLTLASTSDVQVDVEAQTMTTQSGAKVSGKLQITGSA
ncbi:bactofilin family protein [Parasedimentitalea psychrophila]|uniref:Polymer-forming cytoskeletal protein n=1 Tax=Parasedimentitalea psychrophila TaxID=2997337 RepID=A0A9Y2KYT5_9RHOB|nr:polymer-forming cytoskeletal protein [Parasedimentitalea psychrophila]WIY24247.1 polymer-forming cytoskeletal protein [Parasedimentitalea psychrophila]